ncbi:MAG: FkbM family methyltransferase [Bryobacterales bacterium]|nr:FkbM family methyltransferase [Bryobacterales bacterium]
MDIGMCDGLDTSYYLYKGFRVVAVDADPHLCEQAGVRFHTHIQDGNLIILNCGIADKEEIIPFYRNSKNPAFSTFDPALASPSGSFERLDVTCTTLRALFEQFGIPYYAKIDIEGYDERAIESLTMDIVPEYISVELNFSENILERLQKLGYTKFKLINQTYHTTSLEIAADETVWRLLRKVGRKVSPFRSFMRMLPSSIRPRTEWDTPYRPDNWQPGGKSYSGPFGEDTHGLWQTFEHVQKVFKRVKSTSSYTWWDVHAKK